MAKVAPTSTAPDPADEATSGAAFRHRTLAQQRSRDRLERILGVASELIAAKGSDAIKMGEVAEMAKISIGSLYQYFPDKSAIIRALAERISAASRQCIEQALAGVRDLDGFLAAFAGLVDQYYAIFLAEPVMRDIWSATQADKQLRALELEESRACAVLLTKIMTRLHPGVAPEKIAASALLIWQLGEATMRLAISVDRAEGDALVEAYKRMTLRELAQP
ncbi:TetR/AcrR family transcriptional regulator [Bradyrhizobium prioriisuperbiae]|uniref:TetR/AcrR family transcriptional regulator n=1 Tax=Bradyrhizobium prioriisuperbiae TaxID=2854389 RepID=UPI0028EC9180|nr:TetR/AcrR family transcriptional regulator [Bradyrhizobium prioritasuperba]